MTECISILKKLEKTDGSYDASWFNNTDNYSIDWNSNFVQIETMTCLALAHLYDDPENNNFDYPWEWKDIQ